MNQYTIASFYQFAAIEDPLNLKKQLLRFLKEHQLLGTLILAKEGINGSVCSDQANIEKFYEYIHSLPGLSKVKFLETFADFIPFAKAKVKIRKEIVTMGIEGIDPLKTPGEYLSPEAWNEITQDPETLIIDTRNDYEFGLGTFKHAINPKTENFREFPSYVQKELMDKKEKKIAMFCTGGIRCEKSTAYLKTLGFEHVYQLHGGILNYLKNTDEASSRWQGTCFVFDDRIAVEK